MIRVEDVKAAASYIIFHAFLSGTGISVRN
jgi:hypothetical protein